MINSITLFVIIIITTFLALNILNFEMKSRRGTSGTKPQRKMTPTEHKETDKKQDIAGQEIDEANEFSRGKHTGKESKKLKMRTEHADEEWGDNNVLTDPDQKVLEEYQEITSRENDDFVRQVTVERMIKDRNDYKLNQTDQQEFTLTVNTNVENFPLINESNLIDCNDIVAFESEGLEGIITKASFMGVKVILTATHVGMGCVHNTQMKLTMVNPHVMCDRLVTNEVSMSRQHEQMYNMLTVRKGDRQTVMIKGTTSNTVMVPVTNANGRKLFKPLCVIIRLADYNNYILSGSVLRIGRNILIVSSYVEVDNVNALIIAYRLMHHDTTINVNCERW